MLPRALTRAREGVSLAESDPEGRKVFRIWRFLWPLRILSVETPARRLRMSFLDKILGRGKKAAGDVTGDDSMRRDGMHQEQEGMASERAESAEEQAQAERESAAEHHAERSDT
jgi:uncharacterized protein YjbJ (UPF0337 family)